MCFFRKQFNISVTLVFLYYEKKVYMLFINKTNKIGFAFSVKHVALRSKRKDLLVGNHDNVL